MKKSPYLRWAIASFIGFIIFGNHYVRDTVGALEKQIENDLNISSKQYALLNSLYFIPNIVTPIIGGIFAQRIGPSLCLIISLFITTIGNCIFVYGNKKQPIFIIIFILQKKFICFYYFSCLQSYLYWYAYWANFDWNKLRSHRFYSHLNIDTHV